MVINPYIITRTGDNAECWIESSVCVSGLIISDTYVIPIQLGVQSGGDVVSTQDQSRWLGGTLSVNGGQGSVGVGLASSLGLQRDTVQDTGYRIQDTGYRVKAQLTRLAINLEPSHLIARIQTYINTSFPSISSLSSSSTITTLYFSPLPKPNQQIITMSDAVSIFVSSSTSPTS